MKIVVLAGGTGSIALQTGLFNMLDSRIDGVDTKVLVNAYDNGLSTGAVRQVMQGKILGPSDVRKNQTTRLSLEQPTSPWLKFLNIRFTVQSENALSFCHECVDRLEEELDALKDASKFVPAERLGDRSHESITKARLVREAIDEYFRSPVASKIDYTDFSLANIVYAGFAAANGNSLRAAATIMAKLMGIKDNVLLNDDTSLFLGAITKSGKRITDESDIVSWGSIDDPLVDIFFTDANGQHARPVLSVEAAGALMAADIIIMSSGTQWSSLIPTYASMGFRETIEKCTAKLVLVMNRQPDKDSPGQGASEIIKILTDRFFPANRLRVVCDYTADELMRIVDTEASSRVESVDFFDLSHSSPRESNKTHDPDKLARAIGRTVYRDFVNSDCFMFDYDDTLVGRGNTLPRASAENAKSIVEINKNLRWTVALCTGNSIKAVKLSGLDKSQHAENDTLLVYADGGGNVYDYCLHNARRDSDDGVSHKLVRRVDESAVFTQSQADSIVESLLQHSIPLAKIENRRNAMISIKPIDQEYRPIVLSLVQRLWEDDEIAVRATGRTTIEIVKRTLSKRGAVLDVIKTRAPKCITYVGDEFDGGNDEVVKTIDGVKCLAVKSPAETAFFLFSLRSE